MIHWDASQVGITGTELVERLDKGTPRILVEGGSGTRPNQMQSSIGIMPYMMAPGQDRIVADAIYEIFTHPGHYEDPVVPQGSASQIAGDWVVSIQYRRGTGEQHFSIQQSGDKLSGSQVGENYSAELKGLVHANQVELTSSMQVSAMKSVDIQRYRLWKLHEWYGPYGRIRQCNLDGNQELTPLVTTRKLDST